MPTPQFIVDLRKKIGHDELWLPGVTAIILRTEAAGPEVLLVQRADNKQWTPVTGICDPGEQPDVAAMRETKEETGLSIQVDRLLWVQAIGPVTYSNGDVASYMDTAFACSLLPESPEVPHVADDENIAVAWFSISELPAMKRRFEHLVSVAVEGAADAPAGWSPATT